MDRFFVDKNPDLERSVHPDAEQSGPGASARWATAAADRRSNQLLGAALDDWETKTTPFSDQELTKAARTLGVAQPHRGDSAEDGA
jgi:hypothetical protein